MNPPVTLRNMEEDDLDEEEDDDFDDDFEDESASEFEEEFDDLEENHGWTAGAAVRRALGA